MDLTATADDIAAARRLLAEVAVHTPLQANRRLSTRTGGQVWLKREDLQVVRSYKIRGAYNFIAGLPEPQRERSVVCASAGNHAQGVALACSLLGVRGRIFVPGTTPRQKRERITDLGGDAVEVIVTGNTYEDAYAAAIVDGRRTGATLVPAFDHPATIAGQGTIAAEIVNDLGGPPDVLVVPVGGGGLLAGVAAWMRTHHPETHIVAVEPAGAASLAHALEHGGPVPLDQVDTFVDGAAVRTIGDVTYPLLAAAGLECVAVDEGQVCTEMLELYQSDGVIAEPAGALATAALAGLDIRPNARVVCLVSGGNNDVSRYAEVIERSLIHRGLKHYFLVSFPQEPGALRRFLDEVLSPDDDITLFEYVKRNNRETGPALIGLEIARAEDVDGLRQRLDSSPLDYEWMEPGSTLFRYLV
ncbi:MAG: threonine dehydratase [Micrococcales bacterium]|nr:MAG: threonine dehydratase [Micrococcales bacterium]